MQCAIVGFFFLQTKVLGHKNHLILCIETVDNLVRLCLFLKNIPLGGVVESNCNFEDPCLLKGDTF